VTDSWNWKSLLKLRSLAERFVICSVGNGKTASFWLDNWTPLGPLIKFLGDDEPRICRIPLNARVADACNHHDWTLVSPRSDSAVSFHSHLTTISLPSLSSIDDSYSWIVDAINCKGFSSKRTWEAIRPREDIKEWYKAIWFKGATPKHAFTMWTAQLDRLPTRTRLASWGLMIPIDCCLCSGFDESRDHIFLHCEYSRDLWHAIQQRLGLPPTNFGSWAGLLTWLRCKTDSSPSILRKVSVQTLVYNVWRERNNRFFNLRSIPSSQIFIVIDRLIRNTISQQEDIVIFSKA